MLIGMSLALSQARRSGVSAGGGATPLWETSELSALRSEGDDWESFANIAAAEASHTTRYPDYFENRGGCSFVNSPIDGEKCLLVPEGISSTGSIFWEGLKLGSSFTEYWYKVLWEIPSTFALANHGQINFGGAACSTGAYLKMNYNVTSAGNADPLLQEKWRCNTVDGGASGIPTWEMTLASLKNRRVSSIMHVKIVADKPVQQIYVDGASVGAAITSPVSSAPFDYLDMDFDCLCNDADGGVADPTNNFLRIRMFEYHLDVADPYDLIP